MSDFKFPPPPPPPPKAAPLAEDRPPFAGRGGGRGRHNGSGRGGNDSRGRGRNYGSGPSEFDRNNARLQGRSTGFSQPENFVQRGNGSASLRANSIPLGQRGTRVNAFDTSRGQKRKREDGQWHVRPSSRDRVEAAPSVPSFGTPLFATSTKSFSPSSEVQGSLPAPYKKVKPRTNGLGLVPYGEDDSDSAEEDDEAILSTALSRPLLFEYKGQTTDLGAPEATNAWLAERRKNWPTAARTAARRQEELKRQQEGLRNKLMSDQAKRKAQKDSDVKKKTSSKTTMVSAKVDPKDAFSIESAAAAKKAKARKSLEKHLAKADALRKQLARAEATEPLAKSGKTQICLISKTGSDTGREQNGSELSQDLDPDAEDDLDAIMAASSVESSQVSSSDDSDIDSDISEILNAPEIHSTPAERTQAPDSAAKDASLQLCRSFATKGKCKFGVKCRYKHERSERVKTGQKKQTAPSARISLFQRLVDQEREAENRRVLEAIKYLGHNRYLDDSDKLQ